MSDTTIRIIYGGQGTVTPPAVPVAPDSTPEPAPPTPQVG